MFIHLGRCRRHETGHCGVCRKLGRASPTDEELQGLAEPCGVQSRLHVNVENGWFLKANPFITVDFRGFPAAVPVLGKLGAKVSRLLKGKRPAHEV